MYKLLYIACINVGRVKQQVDFCYQVNELLKMVNRVRRVSNLKRL